MNWRKCGGRHYHADENGIPVYESTTTIPEWKSPSCPDYRGDIQIPVESVPFCNSGDTPGCDCLEIPESSYLTNTYALTAQFRDYATCIKRGYKVVWAKKEWFGWYGFCDPAPSQTKYLKKVQTGHFVQGGDPVDAHDIVITVTTEINRYTGIQTITNEASGTMPDIDPDTGEYLGVHTITGADDPAVADYFGVAGTLNGFISEPDCPLPEDYETVDYLPLGGAPPDPGDPCADDATYSSTETGTFSATVITHSLVNNWPSTCGANHDLNQTASITLSVPYTPADVLFDWKELIAQIDLCDDLKLPWRTDIPLENSDPSYFTPQLGPSYGPLICWAADADNDNAPIVRGLMNPAGYEPFFDRSHINKSFGECAPGSGTYGWTSVSQGAFCPTHFGTATQWTDDSTNNMFKVGQNSSFNSLPRLYDTCESSLVWDAGTLWGCKYAEIYLFEFPHHDPARPCGDDALTEDPTKVCSDPGALLFPTATPCVGSDTKKQGTYSIKQWNVLSGVLSKSCTGSNMLYCPCGPVVIFFQDEPLTGIYTNGFSIAVPMQHVTFFDERIVADIPQGDWKIQQLYQTQIDPLWVAPASCVEGVVTPDANPTIHYEENTECEDGMAIPDSPGDPWPWSYHMETGDWF